jgi:hypothetical protein
MIDTLPARSLTVLFVCCILATLLNTEAAAQDRLRLSATAEQGALATYSAPLDVRRHSLWGDRRAALERGVVGCADHQRPVTQDVRPLPDPAAADAPARARIGRLEIVIVTRYLG